MMGRREKDMEKMRKSVNLIEASHLLKGTYSIYLIVS